MGIGAEIRKRRKTLGISQMELARRSGVEVRHISRLENERHSPTVEILKRIADALRISVRDFWPEPKADGAYQADGSLKADGEKLTTNDLSAAEVELIPVVGNVSGGESENLWGDGDFPVGTGFDQLPRPSDLSDANAFALEIRGDSMAPVFRNGALVIVSPDRQVNSGDFAVVRTHDGKSYFKMVWIESDQVRLTSINPAEPPMVFGKQDVRWIYPVVWARLRP